MRVIVDVVTGEQALEARAELPIEDGVDDGIEGRIEVAQPEEDAPEDGRRLQLQTVGEREAQPAEDEAAGDDGHGLGGLDLQREPLLVGASGLNEDY